MYDSLMIRSSRHSVQFKMLGHPVRICRKKAKLAIYAFALEQMFFLILLLSLDFHSCNNPDSSISDIGITIVAATQKKDIGLLRMYR
jgi:hypothetical protein